MEECGEELQSLLEEDKLAGVPILIYANKQDLINALPVDEIEEMLCLSHISDRAWNIAACSATEQEGKSLHIVCICCNLSVFRFIRRLRLADHNPQSVTSVMDSSDPRARGWRLVYS